MSASRSLLWRWLQVVGFAAMIVALPLHSTWVFVPGLALAMVGMFYAMRSAARDPEGTRARARNEGRGFVLWPANVFRSFGGLLADTRREFKNRRRAAREAPRG